MAINRDLTEWAKETKAYALTFHKTLESIKGLYGQQPVAIPTLQEITQAFALSLVDIARYCADNRICAKRLDIVKLMAFCIPHLLSIKSYALRVDMHTYACLRVIHGTGTPLSPSYEEFIDTSMVAGHLCLKYPSQHMALYGYLKGYQEALEKNTL